MITDLRKSINSALYERVTSPLYGTLIVTWLAWNWKIVYVTFFVSENKLSITKIDFIVKNYSDISHLILFPLISTLFFLTLFPFVSNGAYWLSLKFNKWKIEQKNLIEMKQLLTVEQSIQLREDIRNQEDRFNNILEDKNQRIKQLELEVDNYVSKLSNTNKQTTERSVDLPKQGELFQKEYEKLKSNTKVFAEFKKVHRRALKEMTMFFEGNNINQKIFDYFLSDNILTKVKNGIYKLSPKGEYFNRVLMKEELEE
ncbi:MAG: hypothetical protein ACERIH_11810 [Labilibaculum antarcticum]